MFWKYLLENDLSKKSFIFKLGIKEDENGVYAFSV